MKKHFKKILSLLLVATSFTFLCTSLNSICTVAKNEIHSYEIKNGTLFQNFYDGLPFYFEDPISLPPRKSLQKFLKNTKDKINKTLGLNYTDEMETKIFVCNDLVKADGSKPNGVFRSKTNEIYIKELEFTIDRIMGTGTLAHEMTHALLCHSLGEHCEDLNLGLNEGFATQNNKLGYFNSTKLPTQNKCFGNFYPTDDKAKSIYYALHQFMTHDWIKSEGKDVVKKWIEKVKNGEDSVKAFLDLGGDKIAQKYNCNIEKNESLIFKLFTDFISSAKKFFGFK